MKTIVTITLTILFSTVSFASDHSGNDLPGDSDNLIEAVNNIDLISLNVLLSGGASIDTVDQNGNTPLMIASKIGNIRMVRILLAHNPDIDKKNNQGNTALMVASEYGQSVVAEHLIANGANPNAKNDAGYSPLEIAKRNGHAAVIDVIGTRYENPLLR